MTLVDYMLMTIILVAAGYLLYRSLWKRKGHCPGCAEGSCLKDFRNP